MLRLILSLPLLTLATLMTLSTTAQAGDRGLHNDTRKTFTPPEQMRSADWSDPVEMQRSWARALVRVPTGKNRSRKLTTAKLPGWKAKAVYPAVVYMHGCAGIWPGTHERVKFLANSGFVVVAPASLARLKYPQSCDPRTHQGGMYRPTLTMRKYDAGYAIERVKALPFVDPDWVVLMGLSQGGWTTSTFRPRNARQRVAARVAEGITCHAGWKEYVGITARRDEPVLTLVGVGDPWYQNKWTRGTCTKYINRANGSRSVVYDSGRLATVHELLDHRQPRAEVLEFLKTVLAH